MCHATGGSVLGGWAILAHVVCRFFHSSEFLPNYRTCGFPNGRKIFKNVLSSGLLAHPSRIKLASSD